LLTLVIEVLFTPIAAILITLIYYDLRVAKEGFDLVRMLDGVGAASAQAAMETGASYQADVEAAWRRFGATAPALGAEPRKSHDGETGTEARP
jgi:hypothetical protein